MVRPPVGARRTARAGQRGFTVIELIVSVAIVAVIAAALTGIIAASYKMLRPGGPQARLFGAHDLMILEQALGQDGARASCVKVAGTTYGACAQGFSKVTCPATDLCIGWPQLSGPTCHVADYAVGANISATRTEYSVSSGGSVSTVGSVPLAPEEAITIALGAVATVSVTSTTPAYTWVRSVPVTITDGGTPSGATQTLVLHPIATDPAGPNASVVSGGSPC